MSFTKGETHLLIRLFFHPTSIEAAKFSNGATRPGCLEQPVERLVVLPSKPEKIVWLIS